MTHIAYIFLLWISKCTSDDDFQISNNVSSWDSARNACTLAVPKLTLNDAGFFIDFNATEELWVGYVMITQTFRYIGCIKRGDHVAEYKTHKDIGRCFSACQTSIIGVQNNETDCFCFDQDVRDVQANCDNPCNYHTACGGKSDSDAVSVYERVPEYSSQLYVNPDVCKVHTPNSTQRWEECNQKHHFYCSFKNGTFQYFNSSKEKTWLKASKECFRKEAYLYVPKHVNVTIWTPEVRSGTFIEYTASNVAGKCGYGDTDYNFDFDDCKKERKSLCQKGTSITTTSTDETVTNSAGTSMSTVAPTQPSDQHSGENKTEDGGTLSGVYIGVSVAAVAIMAIGIGLALFWRKRKQSTAHNDEKRRKKNITNKSYDPAAACSSHEGNIENYDEVGDRVIYYSEVNPRIESKEHVDEEYETTVGSRPTGNQGSSNSENVYNKLDLPDDTYDHTGTCHEFTRGRPTSNVYGMSSDGPTENQYGNPDDVPAEDTYNHVGEI